MYISIDSIYFLYNILYRYNLCIYILNIRYIHILHIILCIYCIYIYTVYIYTIYIYIYTQIHINVSHITYYLGYMLYSS